MGRKPIAIDSAVLEIDSAVQAMGIGAESIVKEIRLRGQNHHPARLARPSRKCPACVVVFSLKTPQGCTVPLQLSFSRMALSKASGQDTLKRLWLGGQSGCICAREQAKVWALSELWKDEHQTTHGMFEHIRQKASPGHARCSHSVCRLYKAIKGVRDKVREKAL